MAGHFEGTGQNAYWVDDAVATTPTAPAPVAGFDTTGLTALNNVKVDPNSSNQGQDATRVSAGQYGWGKDLPDNQIVVYDMNGNVTFQGPKNKVNDLVKTGAIIMVTAGAAGALGAFGAAGSGAGAAGALGGAMTPAELAAF